jgi:hypothetical protein
MRLDSGCLRGIMGVDDIKDGVGFDGVFVINLITYSCFTAYMASVDCVHGCVEYFHDFINRSHGMVVI